MEFKIVTASSANGLNNSVNNFIKEGWKPKGSHQVVTTLKQSIRANTVDTYKHEYSQTMTKKPYKKENMF